VRKGKGEGWGEAGWCRWGAGWGGLVSRTEEAKTGGARTEECRGGGQAWKSTGAGGVEKVGIDREPEGGIGRKKN